MFIKTSKEEKYAWTKHAREKMRFYRLTDSRIKRIIRHPARVEEGVLEGAIACMQPAGGKNYSEIWTMYVVADIGTSLASAPLRSGSLSKNNDSPEKNAVFAKSVPGKFRFLLSQNRETPDASAKIKIITAWRYPGKSPERDPVPEKILREIANLI